MGGGDKRDNCVLWGIFFFVLCREGDAICKWDGGGGGGECEGDTCVLCDMILFFVLCREGDAVCKGAGGGGEIIVYCVTS